MMDTLTKELYEEVTNLLHDMGTPAHIKGHYYLRSAILEVYAHPELLKNMMNGLYATIAEAYDTTPSCVERSIRNAVEARWIAGMWTFCIPCSVIRSVRIKVSRPTGNLL